MDEGTLGSLVSMMGEVEEGVEEASSDHANLAMGWIPSKQIQAADQGVEEERGHAASASVSMAGEEVEEKE